MTAKWKIGVVCFVLAVSAAAAWTLTRPAESTEPDSVADDVKKEPAKELVGAELREASTRNFNDGNYKDAYNGLRKLALDPKDDPLKVGADLKLAIDSLVKLGRIDEIDDFRETVARVHAGNWRLLQAVADSYFNMRGQWQLTYGCIIAGKFYRGEQKGNGRSVSTEPRDRIRALQLMQQAMDLAAQDKDRAAVAEFYLAFARKLIRGRWDDEPWRLFYLSDLSKLPDFEEGDYFHRGAGAPVDDKGDPKFHHVPQSYAAAQTDGERWRWLLTQAGEVDPARLNDAEFIFARFLSNQFDVGTMADVRIANDDNDDNKTGTFDMHTLGDDETIARLATGVKRFTLPAEFSFHRIYRRIAERGKSTVGEEALRNLAWSYTDRRQYVKAAEVWKKTIAQYGPGINGSSQSSLDQIVGNWARFEPGRVQPAGTIPSVQLRFRNGGLVHFEAVEIKVPKLLEDVKAYLKSSPGRVDWQKVNLSDLGYLLVEKQETQYLGEKVTEWSMELKSRPGHLDSRVTVNTRLKKPGAYLLTAKMAGGNTSRIVVWIADTVILKKNLENQSYYYVADAMTGHPVADAQLDFFGYKQELEEPDSSKYKTLTHSFAEQSDKDGQLMVGADKQTERFNWLITARQKNSDRFAYYGFAGAWYGREYDPRFNETKVFFITDRPVYRPEQTVHFKLWVRHAKYDEPNTSDFAGKTYQLTLYNPKWEKVIEKKVTLDEHGGVAGDHLLPKGATLGSYYFELKEPGERTLGHGDFRVEEYKKPEFEVTVEAPKEPVSLGDTITATIKAKYYFGAPVTSARVKYKVMRTSHTASWYPQGEWDWFYGSGYWWFAADYRWYPGFSDWGMARPRQSWWRDSYQPPELVQENEVPIGPDGTVKVSVDTALAKELHGDQDHKYSISAEVVDESRRTIVGGGDVLVARKPFKVYAWVDHGHYRVGDTVKSSFSVQTLDQKPVQGKGELTLFKITYKPQGEVPRALGIPVETAVQSWKLGPNAQGQAQQQIKAADPGQYRLVYRVTSEAKDAKPTTLEGAYLFVVRGHDGGGRDYRFNDLELVTDRREYKPDDKVKLLINTNKKDSVVLLFARPTSGVYLPPQLLRLQGKSMEQEIAVLQRDMPNFFIEAVTIADGRVHTEVREVIVPPEKRVLNVAVLPSQQEYKPGDKANVKIKLTDFEGKPFVGSTVISMYDKSVEYIAGGSNVPEIKAFFWKWRRSFYPSTQSSLNQSIHNLVRSTESHMGNLGRFGENAADEQEKAVAQIFEAPRGGSKNKDAAKKEAKKGKSDGGGDDGVPIAMPPAPPAPGEKPNAGNNPLVQPTIRRNFADTAFWSANVTTDKNGLTEFSVGMPDNLTAWRIRVWSLGHGTRVGQGEATVTTKKDLIVRLQAPRFFTQKDEVVLSANVHNYLKKEKKIQVVLELGGALTALDKMTQTVTIPAGGEKRVDWRVKVLNEGDALVRMKALADEDSDAMEMRFPVYVHGMLKTESFTGVMPASAKPQASASVKITVPAERRVNQTVLEVRYSPTLAGAMIDALPYMVDYPYGCTEQTLNRFLPTVVTQRILKDMKLDLKEIQKHRTNLNSQEIGKDKERIQKGWQLVKKSSNRLNFNPVFDEEEVERMTRAGVRALENMQLSDGGWGWFSGYGEQSDPHTTATVVHGLQIARQNGVLLDRGEGGGKGNSVIERGLSWLTKYQSEQLIQLANAATKTHPWKEHADNVDAFVYMVLVDSALPNADMREALFRDRTHLSVYAKAMFGLALLKEKQQDKLEAILKNIEQYVVQDEENQTAYLRLPADNPWWIWYGSDIEANAYYLKLLALTNPQDPKVPRLVKYLLNNRRHATYWKSTRDTALCIEAMADYLRASGEDRPDVTIEVWMDGKKRKEVQIDQKNLFSFDNRLLLVGDAVEDGKHTIEIKRKGSGPVYFNVYLTNFTLEDPITKAGLEVRVNRKYYKLTRVDHKVNVPGSKNQPLSQKVEKYERTELANLAELKSGDLVEVELEIDSKNDYEYILLEDPKAAGFEPVEIQSGYARGAYMELRDEKVCFFFRQLARGKHSISYRLRAEIPGQFSALPTQASAMYAPELKGNSDEIKLRIRD